MRQAISTKYLGPTNFRGARVKAVSASGHALTLSWDRAYDVEANHVFAARALAEKLSWTDGLGFDDWVGGSTKDGYVFVYAVPDKF